jgi:hypothetical protein
MKSLRGLVVAILAGLWAFGGTPAMAQTGGSSRVALSVETGVFAAADSDIKAVYPDTKIPIAVLADVGGRRFLSVYAGARLLRTTGHPVVVGGDPTENEVALRVWSVQMGVRGRHRIGRADLFLGVGAVHASYNESWKGTEESTDGGAWGPAAHAGAAVNLGRRLALVGRVEWSLLKTGEGSVGSPSVNLGGFDMMGGIALRF